MSVFSSVSFDNHELVSFKEDASSGLRAIIAVHNSNLGPAIGGCRMYPYDTDQQALEDVLRLSRGMTYKSALAGLPLGGGKAVIIGDPRKDKHEALLLSMGEFVQSQGGIYRTAEDSGTGVDDMKVMSQRTEFVTGVNAEQKFGGDPSPLTAYGIYCGIKAAVNHQLRSRELGGVSVAVQGAGAVGAYLIELLISDGAEVLVADVNQDNLNRAQSLGARVVEVNSILSQAVDVFAPCAMGGVINDESISRLGAKIVAGGANNQLQDVRHGEALNEMGVLYAPDFVINAGGIIEIYHQISGSMQLSKAHISGIGATLDDIFAQSRETGQSTVAVAENIARKKFMTKPLHCAA